MPVHVGGAPLDDLYVGDRPVGEVWMGGTRIWRRPGHEAWSREFSSEEALRRQGRPVVNSGEVLVSDIRAAYPDLDVATSHPARGLLGLLWRPNTFDLGWLVPGAETVVSTSDTTIDATIAGPSRRWSNDIFAEATVFPQTRSVSGWEYLPGQFHFEITGVARYEFTHGAPGRVVDLTVPGGAARQVRAANPPSDVTPRNPDGTPVDHRAGILIHQGHAYATYHGHGILGSVPLAGPIPDTFRPQYKTWTWAHNQLVRKRVRNGHAIRALHLHTGRHARARWRDTWGDLPTP